MQSQDQPRFLYPVPRSLLTSPYSPGMACPLDLPSHHFSFETRPSSVPSPQNPRPQKALGAGAGELGEAQAPFSANVRSLSHSLVAGWATLQIQPQTT